MADLHIDSQLMNHMTPASSIDNKKHLLAVHDENHQPLVFSIGNDGHLYAIKSNSSGSNDTINVSSAIGARGTVDAFIVKQANDADHGIFLAFSNTVSGSPSSELHVLAPFKPEVLNTPDQLTRYVIFGTAQNDKVKINALYMGKATKSSASDWPFLVASYNYVAEHNKDADISHIVVEANKWRWTKDLRLYEQAKTTISIAPGTLAVGEGLFVLYKKNQKMALMFTTTAKGDDSAWTADLRVPDGSNLNSISTYIDPEGYTGLILAGDGLWHITASDAIDSGNSIKKISSDLLYKGAGNIHVAQSKETVSIWFSNSDRVLGYQHANNSGKDDQMLLGAAVPLRPAGPTIDYSAILDPSTKSQSFIVVEDSEHLILMEQAVETRMWNSRPFLVNQPNGLVETNAFVSHVELQDSGTKQPLGMTKVNVSTSGWANLLINGTEYMVGKDKPATVETNIKGVLTIIQPSDGISAYTYTFSDPADSSTHLFPSGPVTVDPSNKVQDKLQNFGSVDELRKAGAKGSDEELEAAAKAIRDMNSVKANLGKEGASGTSPVVMHATAITRSSSDSGWGFFEWIKRGVEKIVNFVVDKVSDAWHFIVDVAGKAWKFILDSVTAVVKGIQLVLEKIGVALKKVWEFVKYIFEWEDIKNTYNGIKDIVNSGLDYGIKIVGEKTEEVGKVFDGLEVQLAKALKVKLPDGQGSKKQSQAGIESGSTSGAANHTKNAEVNNATYHFEEGKKTAKFKPGTTGDAIKSLWDDVIEPAMKEAGAGAKRIADTIWDLVKGELNFSVEDIYAVIGGELVHLIVTLVKTIVQGMMKIGEIVLTGIKDLLNTSVWNFGIFGGLIKKLFNLPDFSILDVVAIVAAIPTTILAKIITGKPPKRIQNFDFARMVEKGPTDDETLLAYNELGSYIAITEALVDAIINVAKMATAEVPVEPPSFSIIRLTVDLVGLLIAFPWDKESPGRDYRIAIWGVMLTNTIILSVSTKALTPYMLKIMAASDILVGLTAFSLSQVVHHEQLSGDWKGRDDEKTGLDISSSVFEVIGKLSTAVGILVPEPMTKLAAGAVMGTSAACNAVVKTGIAVKGAN